MRWARRLGVCGCALLAGCGAVSETKEAPDAGVPDARVTDDGGPPAAPVCEIPQQNPYLKTHQVVGECPSPTPPCSYSFLGKLLLSAEEVHPEASFVATSGELVLAEAPDDSGTMRPLVLRVPLFTSWSALTFLQAPAPGLRARDIDGDAVLLCSETECQLYRVDDSDALSLRATTPPSADPAGVVDWPMRGRVCVYGNGLHCHGRHGWQALVPPDTGARLNAAAHAHTAVWAAGDAGRVVIATPECFRELQSGTHSTFRAISADSDRDKWAVAVGDDGVVTYLSLEETTTCYVDGAQWVFVDRTWGSDWGYRVAHLEDRQWLIGSDAALRGLPSAGGDWCSVPIEEPLIDITSRYCAAARNTRQLTSSRLYGHDFCPNTP